MGKEFAEGEQKKGWSLLQHGAKLGAGEILLKKSTAEVSLVVASLLRAMRGTTGLLRDISR